MSTSAKSARRSKAIDRPFDSAILAQARELSTRYQVVLQLEEGEYFGHCLELPLVMGDGKSADDCVQSVREALKATLAFMLEKGEKPPAPAAEQTRSVQVNIRLTASEKNSLEQAAHRKGFRGISDYVRHAAMTHNE
jgi:predicted RNase H-like HicB family nuclease